jgi:hypothetical protein
MFHWTKRKHCRRADCEPGGRGRSFDAPVLSRRTEGPHPRAEVLLRNDGGGDRRSIRNRGEDPGCEIPAGQGVAVSSPDVAEIVWPLPPPNFPIFSAASPWLRQSHENSCSTLVSGSGRPLERAVVQLVAPTVLRSDRRNWSTAASATPPPCSFPRSHQRPDRAGTASTQPRRRSSFCRSPQPPQSRSLIRPEPRSHSHPASCRIPARSQSHRAEWQPCPLWEPMGSPRHGDWSKASAKLTGVAIFQSSVAGTPSTLVGVEGTQPTQEAIIPIDNSAAADRYTGMAIVNHGQEDLNI